jgi:hypothetical protein
MKKNSTQPKNEFRPSNEKITTKKLGLAIYLIRKVKATEKAKATMAAVIEICFFLIIFSTITKSVNELLPGKNPISWNTLIHNS